MENDRHAVIARGGIFSASEKGVLTGKPRPVLIVQNNRTLDIHSTITVCLISTVLSGQSLFRIAIVPSEENGLDAPSEVQADHIFSFRRDNLDRPIGVLSAADMSRVDAALRLWLDL